MKDLNKLPTNHLLILLLDYYKLNNKRNVLMNNDVTNSWEDHIKIVNKLRSELMLLSAEIALEAIQPEIDIIESLIHFDIEIEGKVIKL